MTREEAIKRLDEQTFKELAKEPNDDCISRADAIKALEYSLSFEADGGLDKYRTVIKDLLDAIYDMQKKAIEDLPNIQSKTDVLDKIRAEIEKLKNAPPCFDDMFEYKYAVDDVLAIIDKYKVERNG